MLRSAMTVPSAYDGQCHSVITLVGRRMFHVLTLDLVIGRLIT